MEFKGTQGKWYLQEYTDAYTNIVRADDGIMDDMYVVNVHGDSERNRYNALLISKAPEMLEMLKRVQCYFSMRNGSQREEYSDQIKELIKEATELNDSYVF